MLYQVGETSHIQERPVNSICSKKTDRFIPTVRPEKVGLIDIPCPRMGEGGLWWSCQWPCLQATRAIISSTEDPTPSQ